MEKYDIVQLGHMCKEEIVIGKKNSGMVPGSAVYCGAIACAKLGYKTAVIVKMNMKDKDLLTPFYNAGVDVLVIEDENTTTLSVVYPDESMSSREIRVHAYAGYFELDQLPQFETGILHIGGISTNEISTDFLKALKEKGYCISLDSQTFLRHIDNGKIVYKDWINKHEGLKFVDFLKVDDIESELLTGSTDQKEAVKKLYEWGAGEILATSNKGIYAYAGKDIKFERFSASNILGRTGRGDTAISSYIAKRLSENMEKSLKFCTAVVSIKMETPGPFCKTMNEVNERLKLY